MCVCGYVKAAHEPFRPLNYKALAQSIKTRRRHEEANLKMMKEGTFCVDLLGCAVSIAHVFPLCLPPHRQHLGCGTR